MKFAQPKTDISGQRFERWLVGSYIGKGNWDCVCDCGTTRPVSTSNLVLGKSFSCGCLGREMCSIKNKTHGLTGVRAYRIWSQMKARCSQVSNKSYASYGGRGIKVCDRWMSFENFYADMGAPKEGLSLDRINNHGNYEPSNCRWATQSQQCRNKRDNRLISLNGETRCLNDWAEKAGIKQSTLARRLDSGWPVADALSRPLGVAHYHKLIQFNGEAMGLKQWADRVGISKSTLKTRLLRGWTMERALTNANR